MTTQAAVVLGLLWAMAWRKRWPAWLVGTTGFVLSLAAVLIGLRIAGMIRF
ncbi:hypothetical protein [Mariniluteicoccus flavus]